MTLLISTCAAIVCTIIWYTNDKARHLNIGTLCLMYWGASLMWFVDAVAEYLVIHAEYFTPSAVDVANDVFLGASVVALGLLTWLIIVIIKDPDGVVRNCLMKKY